MRAILLASATATSIRGLRASILASQGSFVSPRRTAELTTAMAPMIKRRLRSRWPIFDMQDGGPADEHAPVPGICGDRAQGLGYRRMLQLLDIERPSCSSSPGESEWRST